MIHNWQIQSYATLSDMTCSFDGARDLRLVVSRICVTRSIVLDIIRELFVIACYSQDNKVLTSTSRSLSAGGGDAAGGL